MLFIDIETVSTFQQYGELPENIKELWDIKCQLFNKHVAEPVDSANLYEMKAGIFAEFAKIVCISVGYLQFEGNEIIKLKVKSFADHDEKVILQDFCGLLDTHFNNPEKDGLCGHNIKEFDIPFICRRLVINRLPFPKMLDISGKKPWQTQHIWDTMDMWRFGDYKNYTSLSLLAGTLQIDTPKDDIDGSMVGRVYWEEKDLARISTYCQKDVVAVVQIMLTYAGEPNLPVEKIEFTAPV